MSQFADCGAGPDPDAPVAPDGFLLTAGAAAGGASFTVDARGRIADWNSAAEALYGFAAHEVVGRHPTMLVPPELDLERDELMRDVLAGRLLARYETERVRKDGARVDVAIELSSIRDADGCIVGARADVRRIDPARSAVDGGDSAGGAPSARRERSQRRLAEAQERFRIAFLHAPNGIALLSTAPGSVASFLDVNPALAAQLGYDGEDLVGRCLLDFLHPDQVGAEAPETLGWLLDATEADARTERRFLRGDGGDVWLQIRASVVRDNVGRPLYAVAHLQDVTDTRRHQAELRHLADHDGLTGLVNRRCFNGRLEETLTGTGESGRSAAVLVLDLDRFKEVNDTCGHAMGDALLQRVAAALRSRVRATDVVARLGGDEFGILLTDVTPEKAAGVAAEVLAAVDREATVESGGRSVRVTASVGVATFDSSTARTAEALLSDADTAMYEAKRGGRHRLVTDAPPHTPVRAHRNRRGRGGDAAAALERLELWEQPVLHLAGGRFDRVELLARVRGRHGEEVSAGRFLPILKRFGRGGDVDAWVLEAAIALAARRQRAGFAADLDLNVSAGSIADERFAGCVAAVIDAAPVSPCRLTFGVTAATAVIDAAAARSMASLGERGCRFALAGFDASAPSLRALERLPFDTVRIDGELIARLPARRSSRTAVRAIADIARDGGLITVAERVGDDRTLELLREYGIDYAQGVHVATARPVELPGEVLAAA